VPFLTRGRILLGSVGKEILRRAKKGLAVERRIGKKRKARGETQGLGEAIFLPLWGREGERLHTEAKKKRDFRFKRKWVKRFCVEDSYSGGKLVFVVGGGGERLMILGEEAFF